MPFERQVFSKGDRVAVAHAAAVFSPEAVLTEDALGAMLTGDVELGTVQGASNAEKTYYAVKLDEGGEVTVTFEELVRVAS